ncbi:hypothetical protein AYJ57_15270 [Salipiger sp. CCB-MM3]|nr:hypothetical protein AYJ57_15270 [Salipiger sp. CCB-MM3]
MLEQIQNASANDVQVKAMLRELVRRAIAGLVARQESEMPIANSDTYLDGIAAETRQIVAAQRNRDWAMAEHFAAGVAAENGIEASALVTPQIARQVLALMRQLHDLSTEVERDFSDPLHVGRHLILRHDLAATPEAFNPPMRVSDAVEKACDEAPRDTESKIRVMGKLAIAFFGDIPVASISLEQSFTFLHAVWMLPKGWGKGHGRNGPDQVGRDLCPLEETRQADEKDAHVLAEIMSLEHLSVPDKRRRLVLELTPRLTDGYLFVHRDMLNRIFRAALGRSRVGRDLDDGHRVIPSHAQLKRRLYKWHKDQKTACGLPKRVSRPKRRLSWSLEHVAQLLGSPIYLGSKSKKQRWRKATASDRHIVRDAIYWVPLIMLTMGVRPEEILQAAVRDVVRRDGVLCIFFGEEEDIILKTEQSRRILPVPKILLNLGFREWVVSKLQAGDTWLFPEIQPDKNHGRRSQIFGDRFRTLLKHLKLLCNREDLYAMRRTLSSKLMHAGTDTGTRQKILGHLEGTTVDRYYSDHGLLELRKILDSVDYGFVVGRDRRHAFPVITGTSTLLLPSLDVDVALTDAGDLAALQLRDSETDEVLFEAAVAGRKAPSGYPWNDCAPLQAAEIAKKIVTLARDHAITFPASEEATSALEHLLILAEEPPSQFPEAVSGPVAPTEHAAVEAATDINVAADMSPDADRGTLAAGDIVVCAFPSSRPGTVAPAPRPCLVVNVRTLAGRTHLDLAWGGPLTAASPAPYELAVSQPAELATARVDIPTRFNLRRRVLVSEDCHAVLQKRLGRIPPAAALRLRDCLTFAGDVSPVPLEEARSPARPLTIERRRSKSVRSQYGR